MRVQYFSDEYISETETVDVIESKGINMNNMNKISFN